MTEVQVYGAVWCPESNAVRRHLELIGVRYRYIDIDEEDSAARQVEKWNKGARKIPVVVLLAGDEQTILTEPTDAELDEQLASRGFLPILPALQEPSAVRRKGSLRDRRRENDRRKGKNRRGET